MQIFEYKRGVRLGLSGAVLALGFFDGVHTAHRLLIEDGMEIARERGVPFAILTFPSESHLKGGSPRIYGTEERLSLFRDMGVTNVVLADFKSVASMTPEEFVKEALIEDIGCGVAVAGYNFHFGKGAVGGSDDLARLMREAGGAAVIHGEHDYLGEPISATRIREALGRGEASLARELLSVPYFVRGKVTRGRSVGRDLGFPTVNMSLPEGRATVATGVYRTAVAVGDSLYTGITNVGVCPTFDAREAHLETFILDFDGDLYEREITVYFIDYLREEKKFSSPEALRAQIANDREKSKGALTWQALGLKSR